MSRGLLRHARLSRRQLITFALASAAINGIITASVGAWLAQTYSAYQSRRQAIETIANLVYERRTRAGMVASAIRRNADIEEVRHRKQTYDEAYVDWNKNVMLNLFAIREAAGDLKFSALEPIFEDHLIAAMADVDRCITKAYDARIANQDAKAVLETCRMAELHQYVLDCGATFTNELYKLTRLTFIPFSGEFAETKALAETRIRDACVKGTVPTASPPQPTPAGPPVSSAPAPEAPQPTPVAAQPPAVPVTDAPTK
ncbi:hypothetical protein [Hyphomicrobium sp.]|uniref:hypothetical protein n=1 Tax=Hyphomicrobium sp. TaxID=82 RepID=UPI002E366D17|nr:hypothetical protein [Hyphomicrobium sp.]HEX2841442.1 hypothetical protein [Hyphomicrobium sp.]